MLPSMLKGLPGLAVRAFIALVFWSGGSVVGSDPDAVTAGIGFGPLTAVYHGGPVEVDVTTNPPGLATRVTYRDLAVPEPEVTAQTVFRNASDTLAKSYGSTPFSAGQIDAVAKYVVLGGTNRKITYCDVVLVSWAKAANYPALAAANPAGWSHPVTLIFHDYDGTTNTLTEIARQTRMIEIPWRPLVNPDGTPYTYNGTAVRAVFDFPEGVVVPDVVWITVTYNTATTGESPMGAPGPYNELNVAKCSQIVYTGTDLAPLKILFKQKGQWFQSAESASAPALRVRAVPVVAPTHATESPPISAGSYEVRAVVTEPGYSGEAAATLTIARKPVVLNVENLEQVRDGQPKPVVVLADDPVAPVGVWYDNAPEPPVLPGLYQVVVRTVDPNFEGEATANLHVRDTYAAWSGHLVSNMPGLDPVQLTEQGDPDKDGLPNLLEYAFGLSPVAADASPVSGVRDGGFYRIDFPAVVDPADLVVGFVRSENPASGPGAWQAAVPENIETIQGENGRVIQRAYFPISPESADRQFFRVKISR